MPTVARWQLKAGSYMLAVYAGSYMVAVYADRAC